MAVLTHAIGAFDAPAVLFDRKYLLLTIFDGGQTVENPTVLLNRLFYPPTIFDSVPRTLVGVLWPSRS